MFSSTVALARTLIRASAFTPFRGRGADFGATSDQLAAREPEQRFRQALMEAANVGGFYQIFPELPVALAGKDVLDFGCGYGGKTIEFARHARSVAGVEPFPNMIALAKAFAEWRGVANAEFRLCPQDGIPYPDAAFDIVVSHDVIEHVDNPETSLREIARVLRPGGKAFIAFPPYDGALSHHLDYVSLWPGLHWLFSADTLVRAVNGVLRSSGTPMPQQPRPRRSWDGSREVLPTLNGLTSAQFRTITHELFAETRVRFLPIGHGTGGAAGAIGRSIAGPLARVWRERMTQTIAAELIAKEGQQQ